MHPLLGEPDKDKLRFQVGRTSREYLMLSEEAESASKHFFESRLLPDVKDQWKKGLARHRISSRVRTLSAPSEELEKSRTAVAI